MEWWRMRSPRPTLTVVALGATLLALGAAQAQTKGPSPGGGTIICWKDKSGKVVGCGDKVPAEYQDSAVKEVSRQGITVRQTDAALTAEQKKAQQAELERKKTEAQQKEEQRRKDKALLNTFSNEKEIDLKRGRDVQLIESNIELLQSNVKNANDRQADARARAEQYKRNKQPVPQAIQEDFARIEGDKARIEKQIAQKRKDIVMLHQRYDELKKRFAELKGGGPAADVGAKPAPQPAPAASAASGKK
jgi:chromosome segregation ATPase